MRALFVTSPVLSHAFPTVPVAHALLAAGHEVRYALGAALDAVTDAGLPAVDVTPGLDYDKIWVPEGAEDPMYVKDAGVEFLAELFGRVSGAEVDGVLEAARSWAPDVIVHSAAQGAGALAASALGIPCVELPLGPADSDPRLAGLLREAMKGDYARHGISATPRATARISSVPARLAHLLPGGERPENEWLMRYVPYNGGGTLPAWLLTPSERPRIAVTLGSIGAQWGGITMLAPLMAEAARIDAEFVLTLGGGDVELLGELPENVRTVEWVPLAPLLETCAGIVHHAGSGTLLTAMRLGVPQCVLPDGAYQQANSAVLVGSGAGFTADATTIGGAECRRLLNDRELRTAASALRQEMVETMPTPADLVSRLVALAG
ncbi:nucleotide disphospho-sugar-binding domain-containing protein [Streptomyces sp. NBC_00690]|uniref:nucleotide disphospho-sugar-binding domain-containing protein n=1 Tax=Streptomyces sp. NBC_00690 TaxID=2975808 RepID=UPI002E293783|nr:nucleotide disphospho-sugar-binding domain-containing protein [Streptomyces sp. NBC_00690]